MADVLRKLNELLGNQARRQALPVFGLVLVMAVVETLGVASIMPFIALLANPTVVETNRYLATAYRQLGFDSTETFLIFFGSATLVLLVGSVVLRALALWGQLRFVNVQSHLVASRMVGSYIHQPYEWHLNHRSSDIGANILNEVGNVFQGVAYPLMLLFANVIVALLLTSLLVAVDPFLAATITTVLGGVYLVVFILGRKLLEEMGAVRVQANRERHRALYEAFGGIKDIKVAGTEDAFLDRFRAPSERMARTGVSSALVGELPSFVMQAVVFGGMLLVVLYLVMSRGSLQEALPVISLYAVAGYRLLPTLQNAYKNLTTLRLSLPALESLHRDVCEFKDASTESQSTDDGTPAMESIKFARSLELRDITFYYRGSDQPALRDLNLIITACSTIAFVGSTGSGKTTAVDVILGLLRPSAGQLLVDGRPITTVNVRAWQRNIGYVPQSIFLCDDTVTANIAFGAPHGQVDYSAVERAARIANLHEFVTSELPNGYETPIGERGVRLSGGQRQRIGIARALYCDPEVLIFDEATSALDNFTEQSVMDAIYRLGHTKTIILIAHRLSTVRRCDRIFVLQGGRLVDTGKYEDLLANSKAFNAMALQGSGRSDLEDNSV